MARRKCGLPPTEWERRTPEERAAIVNAPFPTVQRIAGKTWAGTIVADETDDPVLRHYKQIARQENGTVTARGTEHFDNIVRSMEG